MAETMNIYQKLAKIRKPVEVLQKNKSGYGYKYVTEDVILSKITGLMGKLGVSLVPNISQGTMKVEPYGYTKTKSTKTGEIYEERVNEILVSCDMEWHWVNNENPAYAFSWNHSDAYSLVGYVCGYLRYYYPLEFITAALNIFKDNAEKTASIVKYAKKAGIKITSPKFGYSKSDYFFMKEENVIAKGLSSVKYMSSSIADELYELSKKNTYTHFIDLLSDINSYTAVNSRQIDILIKIDYFSKFGNQRELLRICDIFELFKKGTAKQIKKESIKLGFYVWIIIMNMFL